MKRALTNGVRKSARNNSSSIRFEHESGAGSFRRHFFCAIETRIQNRPAEHARLLRYSLVL